MRSLLQNNNGIDIEHESFEQSTGWEEIYPTKQGIRERKREFPLKELGFFFFFFLICVFVKDILNAYLLYTL